MSTHRRRRRGPAGNCAQRGGCKPSGRDDRTQAGNRQQAEARKQTGGAAETRADARSRSRAFGTIIDPVAVAIDLLVGAVPVVGIVGDDAQSECGKPAASRLVTARCASE